MENNTQKVTIKELYAIAMATGTEESLVEIKKTGYGDYIESNYSLEDVVAVLKQRRVQTSLNKIKRERIVRESHVAEDSAVLDFLVSQPNRWFTAVEISNKVRLENAPYNYKATYVATTVLRRLVGKGLVEKVEANAILPEGLPELAREIYVYRSRL